MNDKIKQNHWIEKAVRRAQEIRGYVNNTGIRNKAG
jgi:hypothetical protein